MKVQGSLLLTVIGLLLALLPSRVGVGATSPLAGCRELNWTALSESESAYPDAMDLAQALINHGFTVTCIGPSTMTGTFQGQKGAAIYKTNEGDFEALFMPKPQNFDKLRVIERHDGQRYRYSFAGRPKPWPANLIDSAYRLYFVKHDNELMVAQDQQVAVRIKGVIDGR